MAANPVVPTPELQINTEKRADETVVHGSGRITSSTADLLQRAIRGLIPGTKRIVLDLAEVSYIDSSGLGALVSVYMAERPTLPMIGLKLSKENALPADLWGLISETWKPSPEDGVTVF